jgi:hypothetical protein
LSYRGIVVPLPVGQQGFTGTENPSQAGPGHLLYTDGAELDAGIIRKEGGAIKFNSSALGGGAVVVSGINWSPAGAVRRDIVFLDSGDVLRDTGAGAFATTMISGLNDAREPPAYFVAGGGETVGATRNLFLFSSTNQVKIALGDAGTMASISAPAADWTGAGNFPTFGVLHTQRMWAGGNKSDPHRLYYTTTASHQDYTGAGSGSLPIYPGDGETIVGAVSFRKALVVFKHPQGIYIVDNSDPTPANWSITPLTKAVGTLNQHTIVQVENDVLYMDVAGDIHALSATQEFGDFTTSDIGDQEYIHSFMQRYVDASKLRRTQGIWYGRRQQAWWSMPLLGSDDNNLRFICRIDSPADPNAVPTRRFFMSRRDVAVAQWMKPNTNNVPTPATGDASGFVWLMDQDLRSKDGAGYPITFETANTDFGFFNDQLANRTKNGQFLEMAYEPKGNWDLTVECFWDDILSDTIVFNMGSGGAALGSFILGTDVLAAASVRSQRRKLSGSGRRFRMAATNSGAGQDVSISAFYVHVTPGDERTT